MTPRPNSKEKELSTPTSIVKVVPQLPTNESDDHFAETPTARDYSPVKLNPGNPDHSPKSEEDETNDRRKFFFKGHQWSVVKDKDGRKSPTVSIEENVIVPCRTEENTACCTEGSSYDASFINMKGKQEKSEETGDLKNCMPRQVTLNYCSSEDQQSHLSSPGVTPLTSPLRLSLPETKPICDPNILRTLAIPSNHDELVGNDSLPRVMVGPGIYEC